jgi:hypothetical protein
VRWISPSFSRTRTDIGSGLAKVIIKQVLVGVVSTIRR